MTETQPWRLIVEGRCRAAENMARDAALFERVKHGQDRGTLRIYDWDRPAITIGHHQQGFSPAQSGLDLPVFRRPTGGGAVLHGHDITYAVAAPLTGNLAGGIQAAYATIARALAEALQACGVPATIQAAGTRDGYQPVCFARAAATELLVAGTKLMGAAQLRQDGFLLQQGVLPLSVDTGLYAAVFGKDAPVPPGILAHRPGFDLSAFIHTLADALARELAIAWE